MYLLIIISKLSAFIMRLEEDRKYVCVFYLGLQQPESIQTMLHIRESRHISEINGMSILQKPSARMYCAICTSVESALEVRHDLARYTSQLTPNDEAPLPGNQSQSIAHYAVTPKKPTRCIN